MIRSGTRRVRLALLIGCYLPVPLLAQEQVQTRESEIEAARANKVPLVQPDDQPRFERWLVTIEQQKILERLTAGIAGFRAKFGGLATGSGFALGPEYLREDLAGGKILFQMGGRGNGEEIFEVASEMTAEEAWRGFFRGFEFPWGFYGPNDYRPWCAEAGIKVTRVELVAKDMIQKGAEGLAGWVRTTWMPFTSRLPEGRREEFISDVVRRYLSRHPLDSLGNATVRMVRLELEARRG